MMTTDKREEGFDINSPRTIFALIWGITVGYAFLLIMPALVEGFVSLLGFSEVEAGWVASGQMFGMMIGALLAVPIVTRMNLRKGILIGIIVMLGLEIVSIYTKTPTMLAAVRLLNGIGGGFAVGMIASSVSATRDPDRVFALLLVCQYTLAAIGFFSLPSILAALGMKGAYLMLALLALSVLLMIKSYPDSIQSGEQDEQAAHSLINLPTVLVLFSLLIFYVANNAIWAYLGLIGVSANIPIEKIGLGLGLSMLFGVVAGGSTFWLGLKLGRTIPLVFGLLSMIFGVWLLFGEVSQLAYFASAAIFNFSLIVAVTYYLGFCAILDSIGRVVVLANFIIAAGLALGPAVAASMVDGESYDRVLQASIVGFLVSIVTILLAFFVYRRTVDFTADEA